MVHFVLRSIVQINLRFRKARSEELTEKRLLALMRGTNHAEPSRGKTRNASGERYAKAYP